VIDFRYHLVSIVAIFLALAIGIVLGTTTLNGPVTEGLHKTVDSLSNDANSLRAQNAQIQQQVASADSFAQAAAPKLLSHLLDGERVVLVDAPSVAGQVQSGVTGMLRQAGATITGQIQLQDKFFDTSATTLSYMDQLSQGLRPVDVTLAEGTPQQRAAQVLASAVVVKSPPATADVATSQAILSGFAAGGFLTTSGQPAEGATLAVVITPADPLTSPAAVAANQALTAVAAALGTASLGTVMAGPASSTEPGGAIAALRGSGATQVSSVDDADVSFGQIVVVQALAALLSTRIAGSYGGGPGASQIAPSPMPDPAPTASQAPVPTPSASHRAAR
jgi:outer membrane murein-binding lipoprotein Lpp